MDYQSPSTDYQTIERNQRSIPECLRRYTTSAKMAIVAGLAAILVSGCATDPEYRSINDLFRQHPGDPPTKVISIDVN
ncbi:MAG TPA: hypothetical protein VJH97_00585 [Candidatus Nanoarchaeia archaeon]|nr:hypothetical protein [Candidatus Nanoarchaeia archaeon]